MCINNTSTKQIAQKAFYQKLNALPVGSSICRMGVPTARCVELLVSACKTRLRFPLSLSSGRERTTLERTCSEKVSFLYSSLQFELLNLRQWHESQILGRESQCPGVGSSEASLPLFPSISEICHLLIVRPDESSCSGSLCLHLLNEGHTS